MVLGQILLLHNVKFYMRSMAEVKDSFHCSSSGQDSSVGLMVSPVLFERDHDYFKVKEDSDWKFDDISLAPHIDVQRSLRAYFKAPSEHCTICGSDGSKRVIRVSSLVLSRIDEVEEKTHLMWWNIIVWLLKCTMSIWALILVEKLQSGGRIEWNILGRTVPLIWWNTAVFTSKSF